MTRLLLTTSGQTDWERCGRIQGNLDVPLSTLGAAEVQKWSEEVSRHDLSAIYASREVCSYQTASIIASPRQTPVKTRDELAAISCGLWQGMLIEEVRRRFSRTYRQWLRSPLAVCPPQGETVREAFERVKVGLQRILKQHPDDTVGIVASKEIRALIRCYLKERSPEELWQACADAAIWEIVEA